MRSWPGSRRRASTCTAASRWTAWGNSRGFWIRMERRSSSGNRSPDRLTAGSHHAIEAREREVERGTGEHDRVDDEDEPLKAVRESAVEPTGERERARD